MREFVRREGGEANAADKIRRALECSPSKAEKIVGCRYPSLPPPTEQVVMAQVMGLTRDVLYPVIGKSRAKAS